MRNIFIVALRRSGTTVFWESFRRCSDSTCYDEPFNPRLYSLPRPHHRGTWNELINKFNLSPRSFKEHFSPIEHNDEFNTELSVSQSTYLKYLIRGSEPVVIDFQDEEIDVKQWAPVEEDLLENPTADLLFWHYKLERLGTMAFWNWHKALAPR